MYVCIYIYICIYIYMYIYIYIYIYIYKHSMITEDYANCGLYVIIPSHRLLSRGSFTSFDLVLTSKRIGFTKALLVQRFHFYSI